MSMELARLAEPGAFPRRKRQTQRRTQRREADSALGGADSALANKAGNLSAAVCIVLIVKVKMQNEKCKMRRGGALRVCCCGGSAEEVKFLLTTSH